MEYFVQIIQNIQAYDSHSKYEISNLGHVRRIGTTKNFRRYKKGFWSDPIKKIKIHDEDVEDNILDFNNIKKFYIGHDCYNRKYNCINERYKEIRAHVCCFDNVRINVSKINIGFGTKIYKQENNFFNKELKQNNPKIPFGTIFITTKKIFKEIF